MSTVLDRPKIESNPTFPMVDSMRAVGALCVLTTHAAFWAGSYTHGTWGALLSRLDVGVAIFFVLSGFLLSRSWFVRAEHRLAAPATGHYLWKRFLRITPVYLIAAIAAMVAIPDNHGSIFGKWVATLFLANTYVDPQLPYGLTQMWSLAAEVAFYLVLPALMWVILGSRGPARPARVLAVLAAMVLTSVCWHLFAAGAVSRVSSGMPLQWLPGYLSWFAAGIALAYVHVLHTAGSGNRVVQAVMRLAAQAGSCWAMAAGLLLVASTSIAGPTLLLAPTEAQSLTRHLLYTAVGILLVLPAIAPYGPGRFAQVMGHRAARHLGLISYSLFCVHVAVLDLVLWLTGWNLFDGHLVGLWVLTMLISLVISEALYRLVELPANRWRNLGRPAATEASRPATGTSIR